MGSSERSSERMSPVTVQSLVVVLLSVLFACPAGAQYAKNAYYMDATSDCYISGHLLLRADDVVNVNGRRPGSSNSEILQCSLRFKPEDERNIADVSFTHFTVSDSDVTLRVELTGSGSYTLSAGSVQPAKMTAKGGLVTITLIRRSLDDRDYSFGIVVRAYKEDTSLVNTDERPVSTGLIVGIITGVIVFLIFVAIICVCCYRKKKQQYLARGPDDHKADLTGSPLRHADRYGLDNVAQNGTSSPRRLKSSDDYESSPTMKKKTLISQQQPPHEKDLSESDSTSKDSFIITKYDGSLKRDASMKYENETFSREALRNRENLRSEPHRNNENSRKEPQRNNMHARERQGDVDRGQKDGNNQNRTQNLPPKSPILSALHSNPRFRASFQATEEEAEERTRRISGEIEDPGNISDTSMTYTWNTTFDTNFDDDPRPPQGSFVKPPTLPPVPKSPVSSRKRENTASIRRAPRPSSSTSEILEQLQNGEAMPVNPEGRVRQEDQGVSPASEIVAIRVQDPHSPSIKRKAATQHTLRPEWSKGKKSKHQHNTSPDSLEDEPIEWEPKRTRSVRNKTKASDTPKTKRKPREANHEADEGRSRPVPEYEGRFKKSDSARKSKSKSPRIGRSRSTGTALEDTDSIGRPSTPSGYRAVPHVTEDDYEDSDMESNYNPLRRTGSKNSIYASRSSLYARRRRKNSAGESVYSFVQDDIECYRPDRDSLRERNLSRRDKGFRSIGDLEVDMRDQATRSTQTLRECATQTGSGSAVSPGKKIVLKKGKPKNMSSSQTQTAKSRSRNLDTSSSSSGMTKQRERKNSNTSISSRSKSAERKLSASGRPKRSKSASAVREPEVEENGRPETPRSKPKPKPKPKPKSTRKQTARGAGHVSDDDLESVMTGMTGPFDQSSMVGGQNVPQTFNPALFTPNAVYANQVYPNYPIGYPPQMAYAQPPNSGAVHMGAVAQNHVPVATPHPAVTAPSTAPKPALSKWDMLCKMTDGDSGKGGDSYETGSVAGSVFSNPYNTQHFPKDPPSDYADSERSGNSRAWAGHAPSSRVSRKSAWDVLKEMTDQESQYAPSESNI